MVATASLNAGLIPEAPPATSNIVIISLLPSSSRKSVRPVTGVRASRRKSGAIPGYNSVAPLRLTSAPQMDCYLFEGEP